MLQQRFFIKKPIWLIGFMGSGKTTVAQILSKKIGIKYIDTDNEIVKLKMQTISEIINLQGLDVFRKYEEEYFELIDQDKKMIVSTGGGCVESSKCKYILDKNYCIFLDVNEKNIRARLSESTQRPLFNESSNISQLLKKRNKIYSELADIKIDTNNKSALEVSDEIIKQLLLVGVLMY